MIRRALPTLRNDERGVTVVEFALVAPVLMVMVLGLFDLGHNMYVAHMMQGAIQKAARDSSIEGAAANDDAIDGRVTTAVRAVMPGATPQFTRKHYQNFTGVSRPEDYVDANNNNTCDAGEAFEDVNFNATWDLDPGATGFGGARDAVLYTVTVRYRRLFPVFGFIPGQDDEMTLSTATVLRNQPYALNFTPGPILRHCT